jgi:rRNA-processing protein FCF1
MPYFLDGNNLIGHARGTARPSEEDRRALIAEVSDRLRATRAKAVLFFDGSGERRSSLGNLSIRESGTERADDVIVREIGRDRESREITVVTADRELARRARDAGASVIGPEDFWSRFGARAREAREARSEQAAVDVEEWLRFFEDERNRGS